MVNKTMSHPANNIRRDDNYFEVSGKFITDIWSQVCGICLHFDVYHSVASLICTNDQAYIIVR